MRTSPKLLRRAVLVAAGLAASGAYASERVTAGKWESKMVTDGETRTIAFCLDAEQATALNADSKAGRDFAARKAGDRCSVKAYEARGDTVSYTLVCGARTISDLTHYHGDTSEAVKTTTVEGKATTTTLKSRRLGACP